MNRFWTTWEWKLDPYRVQPTPNIQLTIRNGDPGDSFAAQGPLLQSEPSGFFKRQVFRAADGNTIWSYIRSRDERVYLQYAVSPAWDKITLLTDNTQTAGNMAFEYLGQIIPYVFLCHDTLTFHGVLMEHENRGIIISAPSGTGKTTHARFWRDHKHALIINGDRATCRKVDGVWTGFGLPWSGTSGEQINRSVPLTVLVVLERGEKNEAHRVTGLEAFGAVWPHVQFPGWDAELAGKALELTNAFLCQVPVIRLRCRPDVEAVDVLSKALEEC